MFETSFCPGPLVGDSVGGCLAEGEGLGERRGAGGGTDIVCWSRGTMSSLLLLYERLELGSEMDIGRGSQVSGRTRADVSGSDERLEWDERHAGKERLWVGNSLLSSAVAGTAPCKGEVRRNSRHFVIYPKFPSFQ